MTVKLGVVSGDSRVSSDMLCRFTDDIVILFAEYIQTIMMMEESVQHVVMTAIQEVSQRLSRDLKPCLSADNTSAVMILASVWC